METSAIKQLALALAAEMAKAPKNEPTLDELWAQYKASRRLAEATLRGYGYSYGAQIGPNFGHLRPSEILPTAVEAWREKRRTEGTRTRSKLTTAGCRNGELKVLKAVLKWAARNGLIQRDPIACVELEKDLTRRETVQTPQSIAAIERHADRTMWALFMISITGGLRKKEMRLLKQADVDRVTGIVRVRAETAKGGQARFTVIGQKAITAVEALLEEYERKGIKSQWLFPAARNHDRPVPCQTITWRWSTLRAFAGIKGPDGEVWLHDSRRSFATYATSELSLPDVLSLGGWKTPAVFFEFYHRLPPQKMQAIRLGLDRMVEGLELQPARNGHAAPKKRQVAGK